MLAYEIDNSKEGIYSAVYLSYKWKESPDIVVVKGDTFQTDFSTEVKKIETTESGSKRVENGIKERLRPDRLDELDFAHASGEEGKHTVIFKFLRLLFDKGAPAADMLHEPVVIAYNDIIFRVGHEVNRMTGFLRFKETAEGYYYAQIKPDHDVVKFLMPHFTDRYRNMQFAIHDIRRNIIGIYNTKTYKVISNPGKVEVVLSAEETEFADLWKQYYNNVSIMERKNKRLQKQFLPVRYCEMMEETYEIFDSENGSKN